jgi:hypothetical protein
MKYVIFILLSIIIAILLLPIILVTWSDDGIDEIVDGLAKVCGIQN